jgi:fructosamine-3-kinase
MLRLHGFDCKKFTPVKTGKFNSTYICTLSPDLHLQRKKEKNIILRIAPSGEEGFIFYEKNMMKQESGIHQIVRKKTSIPIPEVYVYDDSHKFIDRNFLIMEFMEGKALSEVSVSPITQEKIFKQIGKYLRELHDHCKANKYGYLGEHRCMEPQKKWQEAFLIMWNKLIDDILNCNVYNSREAFLANGALDKFISIFNRDVPSSLLHMDIWSQNILIDKKGNITGIVDWDRALWGDPEIEYAVLDYCGFDNAAFWEGYGKQPEQSKENRVRMIFYHLYEVQKYLVIYTLRRSQPERVVQYKNYALDLIDKLLKVN